jgi:serine protease Do
VALLVGLVLALSQARAEEERRTAIVKAVDRSRDGIVMLKVIKSGEYGQREVGGTGVVIDERGFLLTNAHIVAGASRVYATLADKTRIEATVHTSLRRDDLAVLRLPVKGKIKALTFGPTSDLMVGETVIAIGNPHGFANTVSTGIISGLDRDIPVGSGQLTGLIQHTASINPGSSGGPLLNVNGELIGINVALRDGAQGIAFALNGGAVKEALSRYLSAVKISGVAHGLSCGEKVEAEGPNRQKVVVETVSTKAAKAGLKKGDVLVKVGNLTLANRFDLERAFWGYKAGDEVSATVLRGGKISRVSLSLGGRPSQVSAVTGARRDPPPPWR